MSHRTKPALIIAKTLLPIGAGAVAALPPDASARSARMHRLSATATAMGTPVIPSPNLSAPSGVRDSALRDLEAHRIYRMQIDGFDNGASRAYSTWGVVDGTIAQRDRYAAREKIGAVLVVASSLGRLTAPTLGKARPNGVEQLMVVDALLFSGAPSIPNATVAASEQAASQFRARVMASYGRLGPTVEGAARARAARALLIRWVQQSDSRVAGEALHEGVTTDPRPVTGTPAASATLVYFASIVEPVHHASQAGAAHVDDAPTKPPRDINMPQQQEHSTRHLEFSG